MAERDDLEVVLKRMEKNHSGHIINLFETVTTINSDGDNSMKLVLVLSDDMTDEEKEMRCYAYYLQRGYSPARAEQEAKELMLMIDSMDQTFH